MTSVRARAVSPSKRVAAIFRAAPMVPAVSVAVATAAVVAATVTTAAIAQKPVEFAQPDPERFPPNTLVARYQIDPAVLESVTNTAELVAALREHLMVEASMPLDEPLSVQWTSNVSGASSGLYALQTHRLGFRLVAGTAVSSDLASVVRASHEAETFSDWDEEEAWAWLMRGLEDALAKPTSLVALASGPRARDDAGHVPLRIAAVHSVARDEAWELQESFERDHIELRPGPRFSSSSEAGWEPPEGFTYDIQLLYLELEPATEAERAQPAIEAYGAELTAIELSPDALDRFVGNYEFRPGVVFEVWREGDVLMAAPRDDKTEVATLTPFSETEFWTDVAGKRATLTFALDIDGAVKGLTIEQGESAMTLQRAP